MDNPSGVVLLSSAFLVCVLRSPILAKESTVRTVYDANVEWSRKKVNELGNTNFEEDVFSFARKSAWLDDGETDEIHLLQMLTCHAD